MRWDETVDVLDALDLAGVSWWVAGGWGVDVLAGRETRAHRDLDLLVDATTYDACVTVLVGLGYVVETDWLPVRVELAAQGTRWVDVHPVVFDASGTGVQGRPPGPVFVYPPDCLTTGELKGRPAPCLTAALQIQLHQGYDPRPQDLLDMAVLEGLVIR